MNELIVRWFSGLILAVVLGWAPSTLAQLSGFSLDRFQPSLPGDRFFGVEGGDPGGHLLPRLMLLGDYAYRPLFLYDLNNNRIGVLVKHQLVLHIAAGVSLWDRLLVAADMPLNLVTQGETVDQIAGPSGAAAGDLRLSARVRLLGEARSPASLSLGGHLFVPTGNKDKNAGEGKVHGMPVLVFSGEMPALACALTAGVDVRSKTDFGTGTMGAQLFFGGVIGILLADGRLQFGPEVYGATVMAGSDRFTKATTNLEGILGLRARLGDYVLGAGAGPGFTGGVGTPALRALFSAAYAPEPAPPAPPPRKPQKPPVPSLTKPDENSPKTCFMITLNGDPQGCLTPENCAGTAGCVSVQGCGVGECCMPRNPPIHSPYSNIVNTFGTCTPMPGYERQAASADREGRPIDPMVVAAINDDTEAVSQALQGTSADEPNRMDVALQWACAANARKTVDMLLEKGARPDQVGDRLSCLHLAAIMGQNDLLSHLLQRPLDVNVAGASHVGPLHLVAGSDTSNEAEISLIRAGKAPHTRPGRRESDNVGLILVDDAIAAASASLLLKHGAAVNAPATCDQTPLFVVVDYGGESKTVQTLIAAGADVNARNCHGRRPLHQAAFSGKAEAVELLLIAGATVDAKDEYDQTPLHATAASTQGRAAAAAAAALLAAGADLNALTDDGWTALGIARQSNHSEVAEVLAAKGALDKRGKR